MLACGIAQESELPSEASADIASQFSRWFLNPKQK